MPEWSFELYVELDQAVHCDRDSERINCHDPHMSKRGTQRRFTINVKHLCNQRSKCAYDAKQAVLKDSNPNNL